MNKNYLAIKSIFVVGTLLSCFSAAFGQGVDTEPNSECSAAQDFGEIAVPFTVNGSLDSPPAIPDVDFFQFTAEPGERITLDLEGADTGAGTLADPLLGLFDSACNRLFVDDESGEGHNARFSSSKFVLYLRPSCSNRYVIDAESLFCKMC